jgi:predicted alpha/beta-fold hydrolase
MLQQAPYRAPFYLFNGHLQTLWPVWQTMRQAPICWPRARWDTPDGDFIDVDCISTGHASAPVVVLFHGLEGNSQSHYARTMATRLQQIGWTGFMPHFRGCSGELNRLPRAYHSGDSTEIDWILHQFRQSFPDRILCAAGVSLGGNALMKWLGEQGHVASHVINAAAAVSPPMDVAACGAWLDRGANQRVYTRHFLQSMKAQSEARLHRFPDLFDAKRMRAATTLREFDDTVTAPLHGFTGVDDYWNRASALPLVGQIAVPTLLLMPRNDPFLSPACYPGQAACSHHVCLETPDAGGHVGFSGGHGVSRDLWLPTRIINFFAQSLGLNLSDHPAT